MTLTQGDRLPDAGLLKIGAEGPETVSVKALTEGRKVAIFAVPGAFTPTCHVGHLPSFIRSKAGFDAKGVDEIICIATNDPFVMKAWGEVTGAAAAGITLLSDPVGEFSKAIGQVIEKPGAWVDGRSKRYALYAEDGVVKVFHPETGAGCEISGGEALLAAI